jgi:fimbrial isopeptide formation D2 family protein/uncharacterized repeat protein (TIGR01451 family)
VVGLSKDNSLDGAPLTPGTQFTYTLTARCSGLTAGCVNQSITDVLPAGLDVTSLPTSTSGRTVSYDTSTRTLTVTFTEDLQAPVGAQGLNDGATRAFDIGMRLPAATSIADGTTITNTATSVADNADQVSASSDVVVSIPRDVKPVATKSWTDGSAIAGTGEASTVTLGVRNASSSSVTVDQLRVTDSTPATYEDFDLTGVNVTSYPAGADTARLLVCTQALSACGPADYTAGASRTGTGGLALPPGVSAAAVTGFMVEFTDAAGHPLPYDATGGTVTAQLELRDTVRSTGATLEPTSRQTVTNCAVPGAVDDTGALTSGASVCAGYDILPSTVVLKAAKSYYADTNGNYTRDNGEYAVVGEHSPVSASVSVQNLSAFPLQQITVVEPDATAPASEFDKLDVSDLRLRFPSGATGAHLVVAYADGSQLVQDYTSGTSVAVAKPGTRVTQVTVVYTGTDAGGSPSIAVNATAYLDVHGTLNNLVTNDDLPNGTSPGVGNCASYSASAGTTNGTGTAAGNACAALSVEAPRTSGTGVKSASQTTLPPGQPISFTMTLTNNGNLPLVDPILSDPPTEADGSPRAADNPFALVSVVSAQVTKDSGTPSASIEVYDPDASAWVAYAAGDTALLTRATGVRVLVAGELAPTKKVTLTLVTQRRDGIPDGTTLHNCFVAGAVGWNGDPACAADVTTRPAASAATLNKSISPSQLAQQIPGVGQQTAQVRLTVANTGNVSANRLQLTDDDTDFFDAVDFGGIDSVTFPGGANRVAFDALTATGWVNGTPVASSPSYSLPAGVAPGDVLGLRATFSSTNGYALTPCEGTPTPSTCTGSVVFDVHPRQALRSDATAALPQQLGNTLDGGLETRLQTPGTLAPLDPVDATLTFVKGTPQLDVDKSPNSAIAPGETAPFNLQVTNSGTANLPNLVVKDAMPTGLDFDETFHGDNGQPFKIVDTQVPAGTDPVPAPTLALTRDGDHVTMLTWTFDDWTMRPGATFTIQIQATLAPGVTAGQVNTNTMGATSSADGLTCASGTGTQADGTMGQGVYCTDSAAVTTKAGAAFQARKWVSGTDALGWYDNATQEPVAVGDASCPSLTQGGRTYTAYPCVALVGPGDQFHYLMRMVNSGTEPATDMRVIDRFPVQGDKGVVLSSTDRGTQWDHRPTLASEPTLVGSGSLTTTYADSEAELCTADLAMTNACGSGTWTSPYGADAVGMQLRVHWSTPLAPGQGVSIVFAMDAPLDVTQVADPTVAWNSFGHAEITKRSNGQTRVLPPTEPIQVGVALAYGTLAVTKQVGDNPGHLPVEDTAYAIDYSCTITPVGHGPHDVGHGTLMVKPGETATVQHLPAGATCQVWEPDADGGVSNHPTDDPAVVTIAPQLGSSPAPAAAVTVTNSFPLGHLTVKKVVTGAAASFGTSTTYSVDVTCTRAGVTATGFPTTVTLVGNDSKTIDAPVGSTCTATETDAGGATTSTVDPTAGVLITAAPAAPLTLTVTNTFEQGHLQILKRISGAGSSLPTGPFQFRVDCDFQGQHVGPVDVTVPRSGADTQLLADVPTLLPIGAVCTVAETDTGGADATPAPVTVTIVKNAQANTVQATFTNEFSAGTVTLSKALAGAGATAAYATDATFTIQVTCASGAATHVVYSEPVRLKGGQTIQLTDAAGDPVLLPLDTRCWAQETQDGGATSSTLDADSWDHALTVTSGTPDQLQTLALTATNTFDRAALVIDKVVDGAAAGYAAGRQFQVQVTCVLPQNGALTPIITAQAHPITAGTPVTIEDLPVGAQCWVAETDNGGATAVAISAPDQAHPATVVAGPPAHVTVANRFDAGQLTVTKKVVGDGGPGPYSFKLACTTPQGPVGLATKDAAFTLRAGHSRTISVPLGAVCTVAEVKVSRGVAVSYRDSDGTKHGKVTVSPAASVTVVNTFHGDVEAADAVAPGNGLPNTGGPALWWMALALLLLGSGGTAIVVARRRKD